MHNRGVTAYFLALALLQAPAAVPPDVMAKPAHLFPVRAATIGAGPAQVEYWLDGPSHRVQIWVTGVDGTRAASPVAPRHRGVNRASWDLRVAPPGLDMKEIRKEGSKGIPLPPVAPGEYLVHLIVDGAEQSARIVVNDDPKQRMTAGERQAWTAIQILLWQTAYGAELGHERAVALADQARRQPGTRIRSTLSQLKALQEPLEEIAERSEALLRKLVTATSAISKGDVRKAKAYAADLEKRRGELAALQAEMRRRPQ